eukprot:79342-Hanusia_phi.AAC.1
MGPGENCAGVGDRTGPGPRAERRQTVLFAKSRPFRDREPERLSAGAATREVAGRSSEITGYGMINLASCIATPVDGGAVLIGCSACGG